MKNFKSDYNILTFQRAALGKRLLLHSASDAFLQVKTKNEENNNDKNNDTVHQIINW